MKIHTNVVVIISSWSSGSTSVSGYLDRCGAYTCPPHVQTNDPLTPNAYEPKAYRDALAACFDELTLQQKSDSEAFVGFFERWIAEEAEKARASNATHLVLKHPLQTCLLPAIDRICRPSYLVVTRPFEAIEKTRQRRRWHPVYGQAGAKILYNAAYAYLHGNSKQYISVPFDRFRTDEKARQKVLDYLEIVPDAEQRQEADGWLR